MDAHVVAALCRFVASVAFLLVGMSPSAAAAQTFSTAESSTAVADFNADGRPDLAVANHLGTRGSAAYRIDVQLSNGARQSISFSSTLRGLHVAAVDVDNDHDLDLVVTPLLGRGVVGVWLNDGAGNFRRGDTDALPRDLARLSSSTIAGYPWQLVAAVPVSRRLFTAPPVSAITVVVADGTACARAATTALSTHLLLSSLSPRAPPSRV